MKKLVAVTSMILTTFSVQAADLYLYAGAGLKESVEKIITNMNKKQEIK